MSAPFALGVTGHRPAKLNLDRIGRIAGDIARVFSAIDARFVERGVICVNSLAEGADTIAADAALALGWKIFAPIPFPAGHYARDFPPGRALEDFRRLMQAAATVHACTPSRLELRDETEGYIAASAAVLARSDALVAVWNGETTDLLAGAFDTVVKALARDLSVLWIDAGGEHAPRFLTGAALPEISVGRIPADLAGEDAFLAALA